MNEEIKEIKFDHFKDLEELKQNVENWLATDEMYWERWFGLYDIKTLLDYITNLQEENQELNRVVELYGKSLYNADLTRYKEENRKLKETNEEHRKINGDLRKENKELKSKQAKTFNRIKDHIKACECEIIEGNYSDDKHSNYWQLFKKILEDIKINLKEYDEYVYIPKWREKELLGIEQENQKLVKVIDELLNYLIKKMEEKKFDNDFERYTAYEDILNKLTELKGGSDD